MPGTAPSGTGSELEPDARPGPPLAFHPLVHLEDGDGVTVGRPDIDSYVLLPPDGAALLRELQAGVPAADAAAWYRRTYGEPVDVEEFVAGLREVGFVVEPGTATAAPPPVRWTRLGRAAFSPPAWGCYLALVAACLVAMSRDAALVPRYRNLFFTPSMAVLELVLLAAQVPLLLLHEGFHALAGRRLGLRSRLSIGRRLYFVVVETSLDGLVAVERRKRYLPILAGMLADVVAFAVLTLAAAATLHRPGWPATAGRLALALAFVTVLRLAWQFFFYLRTDLYVVAVTVLGCSNLDQAARGLLRNRLNRLLRRRHALVDESRWHPRDVAVGRWYSWLLLVGYAVTLTVAVVALVPTVVHVLGVVLGRLADAVASRPGGPGPGALADSLVFLSLNLVQLAVIVVVGVRERRRAPAHQHVLT